MKTCTGCNESKPLINFYKHPSTKDGVAFRCKPCTKEYVKLYGNREKTVTGKFKWHKGNK